DTPWPRRARAPMRISRASALGTASGGITRVPATRDDVRARRRDALARASARRGRPAVRQPPLELERPQRRRDEEALGEVAAHGPQQMPLAGVLDALGHDGEAEVVA